MFDDADGNQRQGPPEDVIQAQKEFEAMLTAYAGAATIPPSPMEIWEAANRPQPTAARSSDDTTAEHSGGDTIGIVGCLVLALGIAGLLIWWRYF